VRLIARQKLSLAKFAACLVLLTCPLAYARERLPPPEPTQQAFISTEGIARISRAIEAYKNIARSGDWQPLPNRITLRLGDSDANVAILRRRLEATGDVARSAHDPYTFDPALEAGVKRYQMRNGIEPTGIVYGITQRLLNVPIQTRIHQLEVNLARMQQLLPTLATIPKYVVMNAASAELQGIRNGQVEFTSRTIAGKRATPTPALQAQVQAINTLPFWHVPGTIAKAQLIPAVRKDISYLAKERIRVFSVFGGEEVNPATVNWWAPDAERFVFRQDPGPQNALGVMRFDMPNKHIVYMHDTPMKPLFQDFERAFSAGCVRIQKFYNLADWLLEGQDGWNAQRLQQEVQNASQRTIKLTKPVPVFFIYLTAWVDGNVVHFRNDLYNRDDNAFDGGEDVSARAFPTSIAP